MQPVSTDTSDRFSRKHTGPARELEDNIIKHKHLSKKTWSGHLSHLAGFGFWCLQSLFPTLSVGLFGFGSNMRLASSPPRPVSRPVSRPISSAWCPKVSTPFQVKKGVRLLVLRVLGSWLRMDVVTYYWGFRFLNSRVFRVLHTKVSGC